MSDNTRVLYCIVLILVFLFVGEQNDSVFETISGDLAGSRVSLSNLSIYIDMTYVITNHLFNRHFDFFLSNNSSTYVYMYNSYSIYCSTAC